MVASVVLSVAVTARADDVEAPAEAVTPNAPEPAPEPPEPPPEPPEPPKKTVGVTGRVHGGVGQRRLFDDSIVGADLTGSLGLYVNNVDLYFDVQLLFASNEGLPFRQYRAGPSIDFEAFSRLRLGFGISLGGTSITRETTGATMTAFSVGARIFTSIDLFKFEDRASVYLLGQLSADSAGTLFPSESRSRSVPATALWGPTLAVGVRF
jgi:hypothetical protein